MMGHLKVFTGSITNLKMGTHVINKKKEKTEDASTILTRPRFKSTTVKYQLFLYERSKYCQQDRRATSPRYKHGCVGYHRDMANTGHQHLRDLKLA